jgi:adenine phosphoribosyltransferase
MTMKHRGPRPKVAPAGFGQLLRDHYRPGEFGQSGWFRDPELLAGLGPALADLVAGEDPELVIAPQSRGTLLGSLVATQLRIGLIELRKEVTRNSDGDSWLTAHTPPDYRDRNLELGVPAGLVPSGARVLFVDDWIDTGGQLFAAHAITTLAGARWCGAAVIIDGLTDPRLRRDFAIRSLLRRREL